MEPKTICILSYKRTGSNWLCDTLCGNDSVSLYEPFSKDPLAFFYTLSYLLKEVYFVDSKILETYNKIYNYSNFFIDPISYSSLMYRILNKNPYSIELLSTIQNKIYQINKNLIFKVFPEQLDSNISLTNILNLSDYIIINYRNNILESFISEQKSLISHRWSSLQQERKYLEKIEWNINIYENYIHNVISGLQYFLQNINRPYVMLSYEKIHESTNKCFYIYNSIKNIYPNFIWNFNNRSIFIKENYIQNIADNFVNPEDFLNQFHNIKKYIYE